jgi:aryl-alcohol dehydrogenase-like predicted oxidoreductase
MEYCMLGKSDLKISRIGFGTMSLETDKPVSPRLLLSALEGGINFFDTADLYERGRTETLIGKIFRTHREQVVLATKVGNQWRADGSGWDWNPSKKYILSSIEQSLQRLHTDHIDLYQLHGGTLQDPIDEVIETFESLKKSGKIRYYGISSIRPAVIREYVKRSGIISVMMQYSLLDRRPEEEMLPFLQENQVGVLARGTLAKGLLINKPPANFLNYTADEVERAALAIKALSGKQVNPSDGAIQFVLDHGAVSSAVIGIRTETQLEQALAAGRSLPLSAVQRQSLQNVLPINRYIEHR